MTSPKNPNAELGRGDVIGRQLVEILQSARINVDGKDWVETFFRLDNGATFCLPLADAGSFLFEKPRPDSTSLDDAAIVPVLKQQIAAVLRNAPDAEIHHDTPFLLMENNYLITDVMVDYHGTGCAGLHVYPPGDIDVSQMIDFFT